MEKIVSIVLSSFLISPLITGCASYKVPTSKYAPSKEDKYYEIKEKANNHYYYSLIPLRREQIKTFDLGHKLSWCLLGNEHDGIFGERQDVPYTTNINFNGFVSWHIRNPLDNLAFRVIGSSDWEKHYPFTVFGIGNEGLQFLSEDKTGVLHKDDYLNINFNDFKPFISLRFPLGKAHEFQHYFGWRNNGNFGIALRVKNTHKNK